MVGTKCTPPLAPPTSRRRHRQFPRRLGSAPRAAAAGRVPPPSPPPLRSACGSNSAPWAWRLSGDGMQPREEDEGEAEALEVQRKIASRKALYIILPCVATKAILNRILRRKATKAVLDRREPGKGTYRLLPCTILEALNERIPHSAGNPPQGVRANVRPGVVQAVHIAFVLSIEPPLPVATRSMWVSGASVCGSRGCRI